MIYRNSSLAQQISWDTDDTELAAEIALHFLRGERDLLRLAQLAKNTVADLPSANRVTDGFDFARELHAWDVRWITRRRGIMSAPLQNIVTVESRRTHPHTHPICSRRRRSVHLLQTDSLNSAVRCDDDCFH